MSKRLTLPEEKAKRIAVAATVAGVLAVIVLAVILIIQFAWIGARNAHLRELDKAITQFEQSIGSLQNERNRLEDFDMRYQMALEQGWMP